MQAFNLSNKQLRFPTPNLASPLRNPRVHLENPNNYFQNVSVRSVRQTTAQVEDLSTHRSSGGLNSSSTDNGSVGQQHRRDDAPQNLISSYATNQRPMSQEPIIPRSLFTPTPPPPPSSQSSYVSVAVPQGSGLSQPTAMQGRAIQSPFMSLQNMSAGSGSPMPMSHITSSLGERKQVGNSSAHRGSPYVFGSNLQQAHTNFGEVASLSSTARNSSQNISGNTGVGQGYGNFTQRHQSYQNYSTGVVSAVSFNSNPFSAATSGTITFYQGMADPAGNGGNNVSENVSTDKPLNLSRPSSTISCMESTSVPQVPHGSELRPKSSCGIRSTLEIKRDIEAMLNLQKPSNERKRRAESVDSLIRDGNLQNPWRAQIQVHPTVRQYIVSQDRDQNQLQHFPGTQPMEVEVIQSAPGNREMHVHRSNQVSEQQEIMRGQAFSVNTQQDRNVTPMQTHQGQNITPMQTHQGQNITSMQTHQGQIINPMQISLGDTSQQMQHQQAPSPIHATSQALHAMSVAGHMGQQQMGGAQVSYVPANQVGQSEPMQESIRPPSQTIHTQSLQPQYQTVNREQHEMTLGMSRRTSIQELMQISNASALVAQVQNSVPSPTGTDWSGLKMVPTQVSSAAVHHGQNNTVPIMRGSAEPPSQPAQFMHVQAPCPIAPQIIRHQHQQQVSLQQQQYGQPSQPTQGAQASCGDQGQSPMGAKQIQLKPAHASSPQTNPGHETSVNHLGSNTQARSSVQTPVTPTPSVAAPQNIESIRVASSQSGPSQVAANSRSSPFQVWGKMVDEVKQKECDETMEVTEGQESSESTKQLWEGVRRLYLSKKPALHLLQDQNHPQTSQQQGQVVGQIFGGKAVPQNIPQRNGPEPAPPTGPALRTLNQNSFQRRTSIEHLRQKHPTIWEEKGEEVQQPGKHVQLNHETPQPPKPLRPTPSAPQSQDVVMGNASIKFHSTGVSSGNEMSYMGVKQETMRLMEHIKKEAPLMKGLTERTIEGSYADILVDRLEQNYEMNREEIVKSDKSLMTPLRYLSLIGHRMGYNIHSEMFRFCNVLKENNCQFRAEMYFGGFCGVAHAQNSGFAFQLASAHILERMRHYYDFIPSDAYGLYPGGRYTRIKGKLEALCAAFKLGDVSYDTEKIDRKRYRFSDGDYKFECYATVRNQVACVRSDSIMFGINLAARDLYNYIAKPPVVPIIQIKDYYAIGADCPMLKEIHPSLLLNVPSKQKAQWKAEHKIKDIDLFLHEASNESSHLLIKGRGGEKRLDPKMEHFGNALKEAVEWIGEGNVSLMDRGMPQADLMNWLDEDHDKAPDETMHES